MAEEPCFLELPPFCSVLGLLSQFGRVPSPSGRGLKEPGQVKPLSASGAKRLAAPFHRWHLRALEPNQRSGGFCADGVPYRSVSLDLDKENKLAGFLL